ncbi:hypothetical protein [Iamia sp.]|uniref:hypothetical protein n=1 Tax=Iamia sp. TaxID=2722710 RepID=UPI002BB3F050|nr:hypothetical protein [Iamia sp.]HXH56876.1 hypothetical protein [Iamia sp.]
MDRLERSPPLVHRGVDRAQGPDALVGVDVEHAGEVLRELAHGAARVLVLVHPGDEGGDAVLGHLPQHDPDRIADLVIPEVGTPLNMYSAGISIA